MRRLAGLVLCSVAALLPGTVTTPSVLATTPGVNGRIAFAADFGHGFEIYTVRPNGTDVLQLTEGRRDAVNPDWSSDGRRITFGIESEEHEGIGIMGRRGGHRHDVTPTGFHLQPAFTPNGRQIVFVNRARAGHPGIWIMRADGTHRRRLTHPPATVEGDTDPNISPDGTLVSFVRIKQAEVAQALFTVHRDGTHLRRITTYALEVAIKHDWAPDGRHLVVSTNADHVHPGSANLATIRPDGSGLTRLTHFRDPDVNALAGSYSPDGEWIAFRIERPDSFGLYRVRPDGSDRQLIASFPVAPRFIDWGPRVR